MEDGDFTGAETVLKALQQHHDTEYTYAREVQLVVRQRKARAALPVFEKLCRTRALDGWALFASAEALVNAGLKRKVAAIIKRLLREPEVNRFLGALLVERRFQSRRFSPGWFMRRLVGRGQLGEEALLHYLDCVARWYSHCREQGDQSSPASLKFWGNRVLRKYRDRLLASDELWGKAGYFLITTAQFRKLARQFGDWRERRGVEGWMLYNLSTGLQLVDQPDEARAVIQHARGLRLDRELYHALAVRAAFEDSMQGDVTASNGLLEPVDVGQLRSIDQMILKLCRVMNEAQTSGAGGSPGSSEIRKQLAAVSEGQRIYFMHRIIRKYYWRTIRQLAPARGSAGFKVWAWWNYLGYASIAMVLLAVFPLTFAVGGALVSWPLMITGMLGSLLAILLLHR